MDSERLQEELELLRSVFPDLDYRCDEEVHWVRIPDYRVPAGWSQQQVEAVFRIPSEVGAAPYAFFVRPALALAEGGSISNYGYPSVTPWGADFGQFSWSPLGPWVPKADIRAGANMLNFARSFADRLAERS
jgi:hypothetical protein